MLEQTQSGEYADFYLKSHLASEPTDFAYQVGGADLLILDQLMTGYEMLYVGCGTGGHLRFCKNHARIVGLDLSAEMIDRANQLKSQLGIERAEFVCGRLETYPDEKFDAIHVRGVYGHYEPWTIEHVRLIRQKMKPGGLLIASYAPAETLMQRLKYALAPKRTVVIRDSAFIAMMRREDFSWSFSIKYPHATVAFLKAGG